MDYKKIKEITGDIEGMRGMLYQFPGAIGEVLGLFLNITEIMKSGLTQKISKIQKEKAEHIFGILSQKVLAKPEEQILKTLRESRENLNKTDIIYEIISSKDEEGTYNPITEMFMQTFLNESENNLKTLYEFKDKNKILAIMQKHTEEMIKTFYQKKENKPIITSILQDPQRIQETIEMGKTVFPGLGNNKFMNIKNQANNIGIEEKFIKKGIPELAKATVSAMNMIYSSLDSSSELIEEFAQGIQLLFISNLVREVYSNVAQAYIMEKRSKDRERKQGPIKRNTDKEEKKLTKIREKKLDTMIDEEEEQRSKIKRFLDVYITSRHHSEILKYILRLYRNGKEIRIQDLQDRYNLPDKVFSEEMKNEARNIGIHFINGIHKEKGAEDKQAELEQPQDEKKACDNTPELCLKDKIIQEVKSKYINTGEGWSKLFQKAGYTIDNEKNFIKQFNKIYKTDKQKQSFYQDMIEHIFTLETKINGANGQNYRSIDLEENNRILFIQKGLIDGIYNHNDYTRRLNNLGKGK